MGLMLFLVDKAVCKSFIRCVGWLNVVCLLLFEVLCFRLILLGVR